MKNRYREAAEYFTEQAIVWKRHSARNGPKYELAALILSKLATGDWVLCETRESMRDSYNGGESYTYYAPIRELP